MKAGTQLLASLSLCVVAAMITATLATRPSQAAGKSTATILTDSTDYPPDTQVNVTGGGWLPGEVVQLTFTETATTPPSGFTDGPFVFYATADGLGNIANGDFYTDQHDVGVHFLLTAKGAISGRTAQTTFTDSLPGLFEINLDGNATTASSHDWDQVWSDRTLATHLAGTGALQFTVDGVNIATDDTFANSPKDIQDINAWQWGLKAVSAPKTDLEHGFAAAYQDSGYAATYDTTHTLLFVGTDRYASGSNSAISIWFLQNPIGKKAGGTFENKVTHLAETHSAGDLLIQASLGTSATVTAYKWVGGANPLQPITLTAAQETHAINTATISVPWLFTDASGSSGPLAQEFFEIGVDLNELFKVKTADLPDFSSFIITSRTSNQQTATLSDFILGNVSSGADITVSNTPDASPVNALEQVGYTVTVSNVGVGTVTGVTLSDPLPLSVQWSIPPSSGFLLSAWDGVNQQILTLPSNTSVAFNSSISVKVTGNSTLASQPGITSTATVTAANEGPNFTGNNTSTGTIKVNAPLPTEAHLIVTKHVVNDNGGTATAADFTMKVAGGSPSPSSFAGAEGGTNVTIHAAGSYSVDELDAPGYTKSIGANCSGTIALGETKTCTITNTAKPATLIVKKHVVNDNAGVKLASDFMMTVTGTNVAPSASFPGSEVGTTVTLDAGSYSVDDTADSGYTKSFGTDCSGTIANGETKTCTITYDDKPAHLTVIKHVITDNGGTKGADDFQITVTGNSPSPANFAGAEAGTTVTINAGAYSVNEGAHVGYAKSLSEGCAGTIANGGTATCTITNDDLPAQLTVATQVIGGPNSAPDFTMYMTGGNANQTPFAGLTTGYVLPGLDASTYVVHQGNTPIGYTLTSGCGTQALANDQSASCTMVYAYAKANAKVSSTMSWVLHDSLKVEDLRTGASDAGNSQIVFKLYGPSDEKLCLDAPDGTHDANLLYTEPPVTGVTADGTFDSVKGFKVTQPGTYRWVVSYSGDAYNNEATTKCGDETHTIKVGEPIPPQ